MRRLKPNPETIRATWRWLHHSPHGVSEVRVIHPGRGILGIGYFDDEDAFVRECVRTNSSGNVYVGIQPRPRRFLEHSRNVVVSSLRVGARRKDIEVLTATVIDLDPVRPKDTASTDAELKGTQVAAKSASVWCESQGLVPPRVMMSGNGVQLWFALPPTPLKGKQRERLQAGFKAFEAEVREQVQSDTVHVDSIHDFSRIIKVIGTVSHKGDGKGNRPHRVSCGLSGFERIEDQALLKRLNTPATPLLDRPTPRPKPRERQALRVVGTQPGNSPASEGTKKARRTPAGDYDWKRPVRMCGPFQRLWREGAKDRSVAIFNMVMYFAHKGLGFEEIAELVTEYDRRKLGKLTRRDALTYVRQAYDKVMASAQPDGSIPPPCRSVQELGYCAVHRDPRARCDEPDSRGGHREAPQKHSRKPKTGATSSPTPGGIHGEVFENDSNYYTIDSRGDIKVVSSFVIEPTARVVTDDGDTIVCIAHTDRRTMVGPLRLPLESFHSKRDFVKQLPSADLQWTGNDNNVQGLLRRLARCEVPRRWGATMLGEFRNREQRFWVGPDCVIGKDGFLDPPPVEYVSNGTSLKSRLEYQPTDDRTFQRLASAVFQYLPNTNQREVILPTIGWFFATPMKPRLLERVGSFPILFVWGSAGSGKSSIISDVMWPLFGAKNADPYSATETEYAMMKLFSCTRSVPVFIDEYKPYDMRKQRVNALHRALRRLYRGEVEERGRPDLKVNTYELQAPVCVAGETRPTEAALLERIITANPTKTAISQHPEYTAAFSELRQLNLPLFAPRYIQFCLGRDLDTDLATAQLQTRSLLGERGLPTRVEQNITTMVLGLYLFEQFAKRCGFKLPSDLGTREALNAVVEDVVETDYGVKNALDHFLEMAGVMAIQGELRHRIHYVFDGPHLALHLEAAYDAFRAHCKRIDYEGEVVDLKNLRRLIVENMENRGFVLDKNRRVYFGAGDRRRAVVVDLEKTEGCSRDDFPENGGGSGRVGGGGDSDES